MNESDQFEWMDDFRKKNFFLKQNKNKTNWFDCWSNEETKWLFVSTSFCRLTKIIFIFCDEEKKWIFLEKTKKKWQATNFLCRKFARA